MCLEYEKPSYDSLRNEAVQRLAQQGLGAENDDSLVEEFIEELKAAKYDEWLHEKKLITLGICFDEHLGNLINKESDCNLHNVIDVIPQEVVDKCIIRHFVSEETKDAYLVALEDSRSKWVTLTDCAIEFINHVKPTEKWAI